MQYCIAMLTKHHNTADFFRSIEKYHARKGKHSVVAGQAFEDFTSFALPSYVRDDIIGIWDTNKGGKNIPPQVKKDIFGEQWDLLAEVLKGDSYGIDKIVQFNDASYGFVSDKSVLKDVLSKSKIEGLLALFPKLQDTVSEWIICSNAHKVPKRIAKITEDIVTYVLRDDFVPSADDEIDQQKHKALWKYMHTAIKKRLSQNIISTFVFNFRNSTQKKYADPSVKFAVEQFEAGIRQVMHWDEGTMGLGKSLLDPYIMATVQKRCFNKLLTNTDVPINISVYDKRSNAKQNGKRSADVKKQIVGPSKKIYVTQADGIEESDSNKQTMDVNKIVCTILDCIAKKVPVDIISLHCHIETIQKVIEDLESHIDGFRIWSICIDECDLLALENESSAWHGWFNLPCCHRKGSTGTPVYEKKNGITKASIVHKKTNPFMDNVNKWGPRTAFISVHEAQKAKLIPPVQTILVGVRLTELRDQLGVPIKPRKGTPILDTPVKGYKTINDKGTQVYLTVEQLANTFGVLKAFIERPETWLNKHITGFTNFKNQAKLFKKNFGPIVRAMSKNDMVGRKLTKLLILLLNEHPSKNTNDAKIERLFTEKEAMVISQKLLGRGTDLQFQTAFHLIVKTSRQMLQEIFRICRLNDAIAYDDIKQQRYYILPVIINDIDSTEPTISQEFATKLDGIFQTMTSAYSEMEIAFKSGDGTSGGGGGGTKSFSAINIDKNILKTLVTTMSRTSPTGGILAKNFERLHTAIYDEMIKLPVPTSSHARSEVLQSFTKHKYFLELQGLSDMDPYVFLARFWRGTPKICRNSAVIRRQVQKWNQYHDSFIDRRSQSLGTVLPIIRKFYIKTAINTTRVPTELAKMIHPILDKLEIINNTINNGNRKGQYRPNMVGDITRGIHPHLSKEDADKQKKWFAEHEVKVTTQFQKFVDAICIEWNYGESTQLIGRRFNMKKGEIAALSYHPKLHPGENKTVGGKLKHVDRSQWQNKVDAEINKWSKIAQYVRDRYKHVSELTLYQHPNTNGKATQGRNKIIIEEVKDKFDTSIDQGTIRAFVGPWDELAMARLEKFNGCYDSWCLFAHSYYKSMIKWWLGIDKRVASNRNKIGKIMGNQGTKAVQKAFPMWKIGSDLLAQLRKEHSK